MENDKIKVIITSLSRIFSTIDPKLRKYNINGESPDAFFFTNEPTLYYISSQTFKNISKKDVKIIAIVSKEVDDPDEEDRIGNKPGAKEKIGFFDGITSTYEYYKNILTDKDISINAPDKLNGYEKHLYGFKEDNIDCIKYDNTSFSPIKCIEDLAEKLPSSNGEQYELYIDISGGLRNMTTILVSLIDYLSFRGIQIKEMYSSVEPRYSKNKEIDNDGYIIPTNIKEIFDFTKAITRFTQDGNSDYLVDSLKDESFNQITRLLKKYSEDIKLAILDSFVEDYNQLKEALSDWERRYKDNKNRNIIDVCLYNSINQIECKLGMIEDSNTTSFENEPISRLSNWCLDNNHMIQALATFIEKYPVLFKKEEYRVFYECIPDLFFQNSYYDKPITSDTVQKGKNQEQEEYKKQVNIKKMYSILLEQTIDYFNLKKKDELYSIHSLKEKIEKEPGFDLFKYISNNSIDKDFFLNRFSADLLFIINYSNKADTSLIDDNSFDKKTIESYDTYISSFNSFINKKDIKKHICKYRTISNKKYSQDDLINKIIESSSNFKDHFELFMCYYGTSNIYEYSNDIENSLKDEDELLKYYKEHIKEYDDNNNLKELSLYDLYCKLVNIRNSTVHINTDENDANTEKTITAIKTLLKVAIIASKNEACKEKHILMSEDNKKKYEQAINEWIEITYFKSPSDTTLTISQQYDGSDSITETIKNSFKNVIKNLLSTKGKYERTDISFKLHYTNKNNQINWTISEPKVKGKFDCFMLKKIKYYIKTNITDTFSFNGKQVPFSTLTPNINVVQK